VGGFIDDQKRIGSLSSIAPVLFYIGYIRYGDRLVALINDEEYEVGDSIEGVLWSSSILLRNKST